MKKELNHSQKLAIKHFNGPCLVLAGPGSGKTFVLINRIYNLCINYKVNPENILVITFTRAAATEMKQRFLELLDSKDKHFYNIPTFGTFHSIFFRILKSDFGYNDNSLVEKNDEKYIFNEVIKNQKKLNITNELLENILIDINNQKLSFEKEEQYIPRYIDMKSFNRIYKSYQERLYMYKKLDFSDMVSMCKDLLVRNQDVLSFYQNKFKYILIDEFQDINNSQYEIIKLLCKSRNLFVVGDDDQSIYAFRGSRPSIANEYLKDFISPNIIYLNENYRCAKSIVSFSSNIIKNNKNRFDKRLVSKRDYNGNVEIKSFDSSINENKYLISKIKQYQKNGINLSEMAILYRTNILMNSIKSELDYNNIKYNIKKDINSSNDNLTIDEIYDELKENDITSLDNGINLMTFHLSKGLEFKVVFIIDANDGLIPHKKSITNNDIETERRLFYVATTRAKDYLHIYFTLRRFGKNFKASRFIVEAIGGNDG